MLIDLIGSNCIGKTSVIDALAQRSSIQKIEILGTPYATPPGIPGLFRLYRAAPAFLRWRMVALIWQRRIDLAIRVGHFYQWQISQDKNFGDGVSVRDEGLIKKLLEAVPWVSDETAQVAENFWLKLVSSAENPLIRASLEGADILIFAELEEDEYLRRFRERDFMDYPDGKVLGRYGIQQACGAILVKAGQQLKTPVYAVNFLDASRAANDILEIVKIHSDVAPDGVVRGPRGGLDPSPR